jgi:DMSO/TMAO reductase YedYZ molybdopterin-dependent catalytic subunit
VEIDGMSARQSTGEAEHLRVDADEWWRTAERAAGMSRRRLLALLAASAPLLPAAGGGLILSAPPAAAQTPPPTGGPIVKPLPPEWFLLRGTNAEMRWDTVGRSFTTPNERFFVRNHTATPRIDAATWRLQIFGSGLRGGPVELTYDDLLAMPARSTTAVIECAGNGRSFFGDQQGQPASGTAWRLGGIGAARWRGVPLADVLDRAGILPTAVDVLPEGLDASYVSDGVDLGHVRRPLPVTKALDDVLVAYEMNGEPLPPDHGFPARLVVPGWVGIASIKWLGRIEVADRPLSSPWNTRWYRMTGPSYPEDSPPLTAQPVKSALELAWDAELPAGRPVTLRGRSWSGAAPIRRVEVSVDGGAQWRPARLLPIDRGRPWTRWEIAWTPRRAGRHEIVARATDGAGLTQPETVPFNDGGYQFWATVRHPVTVV